MSRGKKMVKEKRESNLKTKIISTLAGAVFLIAPAMTQAQIPWMDWNSGHLRNQTRHCPYAFTHKKSGLISGYLKYSPYAFSHKNPSGLVDRDVRYSPYAFNHKHNGLIKDNGIKRHYLPSCLDIHITNITTCNYQPPACNDNNKKQEDYEEKLKTRRANLAIQKKSINPLSEHAKEIYKYLAFNGFSFTRRDGVFFLQEQEGIKQKMIIISPDSTLKNLEEHIAEGYEIKYINLD